MSEPLDLISSCCRATIYFNKGNPFCETCEFSCLAIRPDRHPPAFDPDRAKWIKKPAGIAMGRDPLEPRG